MTDKRISAPNMILIGSTCKNSGKTHLGTMLTRRLAEKRDIEVLKVAAVCEGGECIYGKGGCGICQDFPGGYELDEEERIDSCKDTSLYLASGAKRAVLMKSTRAAMMEGFEVFLNTVNKDALIICESNSLARLVKPGLFVMVQGSGESKPSAQAVMEYADVIYRSLR